MLQVYNITTYKSHNSPSWLSICFLALCTLSSWWSLMSLSLSSIACKPLRFPQSFSVSSVHRPNIRVQSQGLVTKCAVDDQSTPVDIAMKDASKLTIGSPIIITEAPKMIKTAASVPCLRVNSGLVNAGDVGRIVSRKPMDVWAVRLGIGTYLIDGKYFKPLKLDE